MDWKNKKVLITGAGGFIGSHLVEAMVGLGADVRAFVHYNSRNDWGNLEFVEPHIIERIEVVSGDVRDSFFVKTAMKDVDVVFHLAALIGIPYSYCAPKEYIDTNVCGTLNVLQASKEEENVEKVVHTSTSEVYGTAQYTPIDEKHPQIGQSPYSASKIGGDQLAMSFYRSFGLPVATIRPFNTYGPRQSARAFIPSIACQALTPNRRISVGNLKPVRDLTYVSDTVRGFINIASSKSSIGEVINIGTGNGFSIEHVGELILDKCNSEAKFVEEHSRMRPKNSEVERLICDASKARELVGWKPKVSLDTGLNAVIDYIRANPERYKANIYNK